MLYDNTAAECNFPRGPRVRSSPRDGCSGFEREPGSDDEVLEFGSSNVSNDGYTRSSG